MSSLRDKLALAKLALTLRGIWHKSNVISVSKLKASWEAIYQFITGRGVK